MTYSLFVASCVLFYCAGGLCCCDVSCVRTTCGVVAVCRLMFCFSLCVGTFLTVRGYKTHVHCVVLFCDVTTVRSASCYCTENFVCASLCPC